MPPPKKRNSAPPASVADRIGALPDSILHHVLSFLPAQAAVQTCVLARRWRHLWRSTTGLRIVRLDDEKTVEFQHFRKFMDHLLILRERTDLDTVEIKLDERDSYLGECDFDNDIQPYVNLWIRFAVTCKVQVLNIDMFGEDFYLDNLPLVSRHLRTLVLECVSLQETFLDFASCPSLENLEIINCDIHAGRISSYSLKHLRVTRCWSDPHCRLRVSAPGVVSLKLDDFIGKTPFLENMALLETAYVDLGADCEDVCLIYDSGIFCGANNNACENCVSIEDDSSSDCVLLGGISSAKHLKLLSQSRNFIFARDLKHCPTFSKLKTLLLDKYWSEAPDLDQLDCILKNSPVLEKLTLQLFSEGPNDEVEMKGRYIPMEPEGPSAISKHLNLVKIKCNAVDKRILKVLKFLSAFNICFSF